MKKFLLAAASSFSFLIIVIAVWYGISMIKRHQFIKETEAVFLAYPQYPGAVHTYTRYVGLLEESDKIAVVFQVPERTRIEDVTAFYDRTFSQPDWTQSAGSYFRGSESLTLFVHGPCADRSNCLKSFGAETGKFLEVYYRNRGR